MTTSRCKDCWVVIEYDPEIVIGGYIPEQCESCQRESEKTLIDRSKELRIAIIWSQICPPMFRDTDWEKLPNKARSEEAWMWWFSCNRQKGLNLFGAPGQGKTRTLYYILQRIVWSGTQVRVFRPGEFGQECENRNYKRAPWLKFLKNVPVLAFDDVDKLTLTKDKSDDLFSVLDYRMTHHLPTMFTGNCNGDQLKLKMRNGEALVRRMRESCKSIYFK